MFTMSGVQIGTPGVGESDERLTFPMRYLVGDALAGTPWIRFATDAEVASIRMPAHDADPLSCL